MRKHYIDLLRQIALFHMFFQHAFLVLLKAKEKTGFTDFLDEIIPICPALFLFVAGYSVTLKESAPHDRSKILLKRGLILVLLGILLFFIEYGIQLPDLLFSPGILHSIGVFLLFSALLFFLPRHRLMIYLMPVVFTALYIFLDLREITIFPLTTGYEPWLPTTIFGLYGLALGTFLKKLSPKKEKLVLFFLFSLGLAVTAAYSIKFGFLGILFDDIGRLTVGRIFNSSTMLPDLFTPNQKGSQVMAYVWNYSLHSFTAALAVVLILFSFFKLIEKPVLQKLPSGLFLPGRCAFTNYFFHLLVLAVIASVFGFNILGKGHFYLLLYALFAASYGVSFLTLLVRKKMKNAKKI